jgi:hypothetical protein
LTHPEVFDLITLINPILNTNPKPVPHLGHEASEAEHGQACVLDLLELQGLQVAALAVAQGVKDATGVAHLTIGQLVVGEDGVLVHAAGLQDVLVPAVRCSNRCWCVRMDVIIIIIIIIIIIPSSHSTNAMCEDVCIRKAGAHVKHVTCCSRLTGKYCDDGTYLRYLSLAVS